MDDTSLNYVLRHFDDAPPEYTAFQKNRAKGQIAEALFEYLMRPGYSDRHTVINIQDEDIRIDYNIQEYRISIRVTEAQTQHFVISEPPDYATYAWKRLSFSASEEIKYRVNKFFNTVRVKPG